MTVSNTFGFILETAFSHKNAQDVFRTKVEAPPKLHFGPKE
jgi:hypothetical protein